MLYKKEFEKWLHDEDGSDSFEQCWQACAETIKKDLQKRAERVYKEELSADRSAYSWISEFIDSMK